MAGTLNYRREPPEEGHVEGAEGNVRWVLVSSQTIAVVPQNRETMGSPDFCHLGDRCYQVKCFGKHSTTLVPGSKVQLFRTCEDLTLFSRSDTANRLKRAYLNSQDITDPFDLVATLEENSSSGDLEDEGWNSESRAQFGTPWDPIIREMWRQMHEGDPVALHSYQIITRDGEYIVVLNDHLSHWQSKPLSLLSIVNNEGEFTEDPQEGAWPSTEVADCAICTILRDDVKFVEES